MLAQIKTFDKNVLAVEVINSYTETDLQFCYKLMQKKLDEGYSTLNFLIRIDELKLSHTNIKVIFEDMKLVFEEFKHFGNIAIVAHSKFIEMTNPLRTFLYERISGGKQVRYFDVNELDDALDWISNLNEE